VVKVRLRHQDLADQDPVITEHGFVQGLKSSKNRMFMRSGAKEAPFSPGVVVYLCTGIDSTWEHMGHEIDSGQGNFISE
jgi:hypothetical protein